MLECWVKQNLTKNSAVVLFYPSFQSSILPIFPPSLLTPNSCILDSKYTLLHIRGRDDRPERENSVFS
jgi:hypothetical protein